MDHSFSGTAFYKGCPGPKNVAKTSSKSYVLISDMPMQMIFLRRFLCTPLNTHPPRGTTTLRWPRRAAGGRVFVPIVGTLRSDFMVGIRNLGRDSSYSGEGFG